MLQNDTALAPATTLPAATQALSPSETADTGGMNPVAKAFSSKCHTRERTDLTDRYTPDPMVEPRWPSRPFKPLTTIAPQKLPRPADTTKTCRHDDNTLPTG